MAKWRMEDGGWKMEDGGSIRIIALVAGIYGHLLCLCIQQEVL
jgi:hypothetical protein